MAGRPTASAPSWPPASTGSASTTSTPRSSAWAAPRCRCPTPSRWSWRRCRSKARSRPPRAGCWPRAGSHEPRREGSLSEELVMPRLSDTMEQGTIGRWLVKEGDSFSEGDVLAEIETDKALMELQAYDAATMLRILVNDGETADLGAPIAIVGDAGEDVAASDGKAEEPEAAAEEPEVKAQPEAEAEAEPGPTGKAPAGTTLKVSPIGRKMADQAGIDLAPLAGRGSGPEGRIVKADVERLIDGGGVAAPPAPTPAAPAQAPAAPAPAAEDEVRELSPILKAVAQRMGQSKSTVPHFYVESEIDMTRAMEMRAELN